MKYICIAEADPPEGSVLLLAQTSENLNFKNSDDKIDVIANFIYFAYSDFQEPKTLIVYKKSNIDWGVKSDEVFNTLNEARKKFFDKIFSKFLSSEIFIK